MLDSIVEQSPAKINLFLKVISKRVDGFHNIRSGVTLVNLFDEVIAKKIVILKLHIRVILLLQIMFSKIVS